jgi:hypothetical protein
LGLVVVQVQVTGFPREKRWDKRWKILLIVNEKMRQRARKKGQKRTKVRL